MSSGIAGRVAVGLTLGSVMLVGCARFDESASSPFTAGPSFGGDVTEPTEPPPLPTRSPRPKGPCIDPDPNVVATCLDSGAGLVSLGGYALVTERRTGRILQVTLVDPSMPQLPPVEIATIQVDAKGDGGLSDIALSPTFREDGLIYAYVTTPSDNRVVRISQAGTVKPILTGIPRGSDGNRGAIEWASPTALMVLTGDAGNTSAANDPGSLSGKILRLDNPSSGTNTPTVVGSGLGAAGDICRDGKKGMWVTDRTATEDRLQHLGADGDLRVAWTWADQPGVGGCAATPGGGVAIALTEGKALAVFATDPATFAVTIAPSMLVLDVYGKLLGAAPGGDGSIWVTTTNKTDGTPGEFDDRVVQIPPLGVLPAGKQ
ncbi:PQQ-dependent sugar dehydrogenase [Nocardia salmonicida]|uniref:PQQ-dependent sugar dehydrogenase n=1 Tax=Nocardia salmonicida TaxID=53431 RepID=UPI0007A3F50D|nr:PQQ-dependent sugar dehydrogenase [Nocardia salmonicida]